MKLEERKRRIFGKRSWRKVALGCLALSGLLLLMLVFKDPWQDPAQILVFGGQFHPLLLHLPIGMLVIVLLMEMISWHRGRKSHATMPLFMATLSAIGAVIFGYLLMRVSEYPADAIDSHLWSGVIFTVVLVWTLFFKLRYNETGKGQLMYWILLLLSVFLMFAAGHYGGVITHGDPMDEAPWRKKESKVELPTIDERLVYEQVVVPILEQKCYKCHGPKKKKGHLRMDRYADMLEGGDEGECLVPGDLEQSMMIELIRLPEGDDDRMPPEGKPQLTKEEQTVIEWWVKIGAPQGTKLASLDIPEDVETALGVIAGQSLKKEKQEDGGNKGASSQEKSEPDVAKIQKSHAADVQKLQSKYAGALTWLSQSDATLVFTAVGMRSDFKDADLNNLKPIAKLLKQLDLTGADVTDASAPLLASMTSLQSLRLPETKITDSAMPAIAGLTKLESLNLYGTAITDEGLLKLGSLKQLKKLYLWQTKVTPYGVKALQKVLPECEMITGDGGPEAVDGGQ